MRRELKKINAELDRFWFMPDRSGPSHQEIKIVDKIIELSHREEVMWQQRSRIMWLTAGDKNTKFFHQLASQRKWRNKISKLKRVASQVIEDEQEMGSMASAFYKSLYTSKGTTDMNRVLDSVPIKVTSEMNNQLLCPFDKEEVKVALFQMFPTKALGPDGYSMHFFQRHWDICGDEVTTVVLRVLQGQDDPSIINNTSIMLIPKVD